MPTSTLTSYLHHGRAVHRESAGIVRSALDALKGKSGELLAAEITADWFPAVQADVFISHSHKDGDLAVALSGFLHQEFGIRSFVDFTVWGYGEDLLRLLDDEYCLNRGRETYNYAKRNRSTAHVYMMVSVALCRMIDRCECIFFLNTPTAISGQSYIGGSSTDSPWIYSEIAMTSLIQKKTLAEHRRMLTSTAAVNEALQVRYQVDLEHLTALSASDLDRWKRTYKASPGTGALDLLYQIT